MILYDCFLLFWVFMQLGSGFVVIVFCLISSAFRACSRFFYDKASFVLSFSQDQLLVLWFLVYCLDLCPRHRLLKLAAVGCQWVFELLGAGLRKTLGC